MEVSKENVMFYVYVEYKRGKSPTLIFNQLKEVFSPDKMYGLSTIQRWCSNYSNGLSACIGDHHNAGRKSMEWRDNEVIELINVDRRLSVRAIAYITNIPKSSVERILQKYGYRSVLGVWVPKLLSDANKQSRIESAELIKNYLQKSGQRRYTRYVIEDETWIYHDVTFRNIDRRVRIKKNEPRPQFPKSKLTPAKSMVLISMTADCKFSVDVINNGESINAERYKQFVDVTFHRWRNLRSKPLRFRDGEIYWQHDNARPHVAKSTMKYMESKVTLVKQAPYSPDLNILDRWLIRKIKEDLNQIELRNDRDVLLKTQHCLRNIEENDLRHQIDLLMEHCDDVIKCRGAYVTD